VGIEFPLFPHQKFQDGECDMASNESNVITFLFLLDVAILSYIDIITFSYVSTAHGSSIRKQNLSASTPKLEFTER
jgi:hypothetical protein